MCSNTCSLKTVNGLEPKQHVCTRINQGHNAQESNLSESEMLAATTGTCLKPFVSKNACCEHQISIIAVRPCQGADNGGMHACMHAKR